MSIEEFIEKFKNASNEAHNLSSIMAEFENSMSGIDEKIGYVNAAVSEFNESGYITAETFKNITDNGLWEYLDFTEQGLVANANALLESGDAAKYKALMDLQAAFAQDAYAIATGDASKASSTAQGIMAGLGDNVSYAAEMARAATGDYFSLAGAITAANNAAAKDKKKIDTKSVESELQQLTNMYNKYAQGIVNTNFTSSGKVSGSGGSRSSGSGSSAAAKSTKEWWEEQLSALKDQFQYNEITIDEYINSLQSLLGKVSQGTEAYRKINEELQKQKLSRLEDQYKRGQISLEQYIASLKELLKTYRQGSEDWLKFIKSNDVRLLH